MPRASRGRPWGSKVKALTDEMRRALMENDQNKLKKVVRAVIREAIDGDMAAAQIIFDRVEGKLYPSDIDKDERPIIHVVMWEKGDRPLEMIDLPRLENGADPDTEH